MTSQVLSAEDTAASHIIKIVFVCVFSVTSPWVGLSSLQDVSLSRVLKPVLRWWRLWRGSEELKSISHFHCYHLILQQMSSHTVSGSLLGTRRIEKWNQSVGEGHQEDTTPGLTCELDQGNWGFPPPPLCLECALCLSPHARSCPRTQTWESNVLMKLRAWLNPVKTSCICDCSPLKPLYKPLRFGRWTQKSVSLMAP